MARPENSHASQICAVQGPPGMSKNDGRHVLQEEDYHLANSGGYLGAKGKARMGLEKVKKVLIQNTGRR
jgi:hypothetical protein